MSSPSFANCGPGTAPVEFIVDYLNRNGVTEHFEVEEPKRSMVVNRVNGMVPPTNWVPDRVVVYTRRGVGILVFHIGDCVWSPGPMPLRRLEALRPTGRAS